MFVWGNKLFKVEASVYNAFVRYFTADMRPNKTKLGNENELLYVLYSLLF